MNAGERCPLHGIAGSASAMFSRMDRLKSTFSCKKTPISRRSQVGSTTGTSTPSTSFTGQLASTQHRPAPQGLGKTSLDDRKSQFLSTPRRQTGILVDVYLVPSGEC